MLNIAILGLGWWGRHIITTLENISIINVVAAASRTVDKHKKFATEKNIILYEDYNTLLNDPLVDGIVLCTPNTQHEEQVKKVTVSIPTKVLQILTDERTRRQVNNLRHATNSELLCEAFLHAYTGQPLPGDDDLDKNKLETSK